MTSCAEVREGLTELAAVRPEELSPEVREHLAGCAPCARALLARRVFQQALEALLLERKNAG